MLVLRDGVWVTQTISRSHTRLIGHQLGSVSMRVQGGILEYQTMQDDGYKTVISQMWNLGCGVVCRAYFKASKDLVNTERLKMAIPGSF